MADRDDEQLEDYADVMTRFADWCRAHGQNFRALLAAFARHCMDESPRTEAPDDEPR